MCGIFAPQLQTWWINLWYFCECVCEFYFFLITVLSVWDTLSHFSPAEIKCKQIEKLFFLCSYWLNCVFLLLYFLWIIYYYYYSIINSEIKKEVCRRKKKICRNRVSRSLSLFCFVLLDFCCRKSREPNVFGLPK